MSEHRSKVFRHHALLCVLFEHCSDSVWTCYTPFPCVRTVFEQPAVRWCAVRTLFKQFVLVWQCPNTVRKCLDITHCFACCLNTVRTVFGYIILSFHVFEQCSNTLPCVGVLFEHCSNSLSLFGNVRTLFESVQTSRTALRAV